MPALLLNLETGQAHPMWTNPDAVGFLIGYLDAFDLETSTEDQMTAGYRKSAGVDPIPAPVSDFAVHGDFGSTGGLVLTSTKYPEDAPYREVSRTQAGDGALVVMFEAAMTCIIRDEQINWVARLD